MKSDELEKDYAKILEIYGVKNELLKPGITFKSHYIKSKIKASKEVKKLFYPIIK